MVIVSQGDVSYFHHLQGVVGDFNAVRIQHVSVFSLTTSKFQNFLSRPNYLLFLKTPKLCDNLIAIQIHISEFMGFFYIQNSVFKPFLSTP